VCTLLALYRRGTFAASLDPAAGLCPSGVLSDVDRLIAQMLLALPDEEGAMRAALSQLGASGANRVLGWVLMSPQDGIGPTVAVLHPRRRYRAGPLELRILTLRIGTNGMRIDSKVWLWWFRIGGPRRMRTVRWSGFAAIEDEQGTPYMWMPPPLPPGWWIEAAQGGRFRPVTSRTHYWWPAPPRDARRLLLTVVPRITLESLSAQPPPGVSRRVREDLSLPELVCTVDLPRLDPAEGTMRGPKETGGED
jgi:hypothetical protein